MASKEAELIAASASGDLEKVKKLLGEGADVTYQDAEGMSALMKAADGGHVEVVRALLDGGVPWNLQDKEGYTAGEYAAGPRRKEIVEMIMDWGVQAELVLGAMERQKEDEGSKAVNSDYLQQKLHYEGEKLLDADGEAVMMGWEGPLMERHAEVISKKGGHVLNVGFGLGLVDEALQKQQPASHTIIEAHPDVYAHMMERGWGKRPGVKVLFGRWQDVLPQLETYDGIFFDTYGEYYDELREFHAHLPRLLRPGGTYSFFNGLAPDNIFFHMVYGRLVQLELSALGITTSYTPMNIKTHLEPNVWEGVKNKYWHFETYFLPICQLASDQNDNKDTEGGKDA